ncbi:integral membrane protein 2C-like isoform X1 [Entelurus aequoreus]|uniref:integral membrane protein 2C-like isoform X1 n=1 Tax=Entelurus aequoreus TaxID=161455 RepID=UPI002B1E84EA|nr:integral membrane protein 2C-like isoform X1 [Entelurus aequoreus]
MVKITFQAVSAPKADKDNEEDHIVIPQAHDQQTLPIKGKKHFPTRLCSLICGVVVLIVGLTLASIYAYRDYYYPQQLAAGRDFFHCRVVFEDTVYAPLRGRQELEENVGIYLDENYEQISVPVPYFGGCDPADIIHDFERGLTAYYDIALDSCYITELNTTMVMRPRNLWELLVNLKVGAYLPHTYLVREEMVVTGRVRNMRQLGPYIHRLCYSKDTYRLRRRSQHQRVERRETKKCQSIRHFENPYVVETRICNRF